MAWEVLSTSLNFCVKVWCIVFLTLVSGSFFWVVSHSFMSSFMIARLALIRLKFSPFESMILFKTSTLTTVGWNGWNWLTLLISGLVLVDLLLSYFAHTGIVTFTSHQPLLNVFCLAKKFPDKLSICVLLFIVINKPGLEVNRIILLLCYLQKLWKTVQHVFNIFSSQL